MTMSTTPFAAARQIYLATFPFVGAFCAGEFLPYPVTLTCSGRPIGDHYDSSNIRGSAGRSDRYPSV